MGSGPSTQICVLDPSTQKKVCLGAADFKNILNKYSGSDLAAEVKKNREAIANNTASVNTVNSKSGDIWKAISAAAAKNSITNEQVSAIAANTAKKGITDAQASAIAANTAKKGITDAQASAIAANTAGVAKINSTLAQTWKFLLGEANK